MIEISMRGAKGDKGDTGAKGDTGSAGADGTNGSAVLYFAPSASQTVSNTTTETNFNKSFALAANYFTAGKVLRVRAWGLYSSNVTTATLIIRVKLGTSAVCLYGTIPTAGANNMDWVLDALIVCQTTGTAGNFQAAGTITLGTSASDATAATYPARFTTTTQNTTAAQTFQLSAQFSVADVHESIVMNGMVLEELQS